MKRRKQRGLLLKRLFKPPKMLVRKRKESLNFKLSLIGRLQKLKRQDLLMRKRKLRELLLKKKRQGLRRRLQLLPRLRGSDLKRRRLKDKDWLRKKRDLD